MSATEHPAGGRPVGEHPMRVMRVIARLNMGGPALHVSYLAAGLEQRGYATTLVSGTLARGESSMAFVADRLGVRVVPLPELGREISPLRDVVAAWKLSRLVRDERPHILHTHTAKAGTIGRLAALLSGSARPPIVVHTFHGHILSGYFDPVRASMFRLLERGLAHVATALVAVSPEVRDELVRFGVAPSSKFVVIRLGIELEKRVHAEPGLREESRRQLGVTPDRFFVGWVGRMTGVKRVDDVLVGFARLRELGVDAVLGLIGDGPDREGIERRAGELGIIRHCLFLGYQEEVAPFYAAFDTVVLPSANEGTPVSVIESLAAGRPVVATRVGGVPDVVQEGVDGFLVETGDTEALAQQLAVLARDPGLRTRMGEAGRERILRRYAVDRLIDDIDLLYRSLLESKGLGGLLGPRASPDVPSSVD